jgi:soluble P-type ATPase
MTKPGIHLDIPGLGRKHVIALLTDFTGTLSRGGVLSEGVADALTRLAAVLDVHVLTADTFGVAARQLAGLPVKIVFLSSSDHTAEKRARGQALDLSRAVALGNGNNDCLLLEATRDAGGISIAVDNGEGCATATLLRSSLFIVGAANALNLLLEPRGLIATLRR